MLITSPTRNEVLLLRQLADFKLRSMILVVRRAVGSTDILWGKTFQLNDRFLLLVLNDFAKILKKIRIISLRPFAFTVLIVE